LAIQYEYPGCNFRCPSGLWDIKTEHVFKEIDLFQIVQTRDCLFVIFKHL